MQSNLKILVNKSTSGMIVADPYEVKNRFKELNPGFTFNYPKGSRSSAGLFLFLAEIPKDGEPFIELWDLNNQSLVHKWNIETSRILKNWVLIIT